MTTASGEDSYSFAAPDGRGPVLLRPEPAGSDPFGWLTSQRARIDDILLRFGAVVIRDAGFRSVSDFNRAAQILCPALLDYVNRSTPRTKLGGKIYTATEYPADKSIPLHNESSYADVWPTKIMFYSAVVAAEGGETPVADSRLVYQRIDEAVRKRFEDVGVLYVRNYTPGIDLSWQDVFQTDDRDQASAFCVEHGIEAEWRDGPVELTTRQRCQATLAHPVTGERVWFNQAHLFHVSALEPAEQRALIEEVGPGDVPRNALYGDGTEIEPEVLDHIRAVYEQEKVAFGWQRGDVMVLDNVLFAHARNPFKGPRKLVVAMG